MRYTLPIYVRHTSALAAPGCVWSMRNTHATRSVQVARLLLESNFDGTVAASMGRWEVQRFNGATPTGGTALAVIGKSPNQPASLITDARFLDTGLTVTGCVFETAMGVIAVTRQRGLFYLPFIDDATPNILLPPGYGLAIRLGVVAVIGDELVGHVEIEE